MQASKIDLGQVYAVRRKKPDGDYELVRFRPSSVTTTRFRKTGSPHDFRSHVTGYIQEDASTGGNPEVQLQPDELLGPYTEYLELVQRKQAEHEAREQAEKARAEKAEKLISLMYQATGLSKPDSPIDRYSKKRSDFNDPFRVYSNDGVAVQPDHEGVDRLTLALQRLIRLQAGEMV